MESIGDVTHLLQIVQAITIRRTYESTIYQGK